jgi:coenzyme F420-reducing hydrogenase beta subunit
MQLDNNLGVFLPSITDDCGVVGNGTEFMVCPGKGVPLGRLSQKLYGDSPESCLELGHYRCLRVVRSTDSDILKNASSGGIMTQLAVFLLEKDYVEGSPLVP